MVQRMVAQRKDDPVEKAVLNDDELVGVKADVDAAMKKIKDKIVSWAKESNDVAKKLQSTGRDAWVYAGFFKRNNTLKQHLENWDESWSLENTCGLLLDLGNTLRRLCTEGKVMNDTMKGSRSSDHGLDKTSTWAKDFVPEESKLQSGVSATTGNLLRTLRELDVTSNDEIEALMIGVVKFWRDGSWIKWIRGEFHTAAEVWAAYTYHLEEYVMKD